MAAPLEVSNVRKTYTSPKLGAVDAVKGVSFEIRPGEIYGLLGPNGAGKTTLISMITTLENPSQGEIKVFGESTQTNSAFTKKQIGVVPQEIVTQGFFNLVEILQFHSGYYGVWNNKERIEYLLKRLGLWEHKHKLVKQLSGGMKRRLMIAKALVHKPKLLLLDEPTAGVDLELRTSLWEFVRDLQKEGISILLTTHYLQEAEALCERVGIINKGSLVFSGETQGIIRKLTRRTVEMDLKSIPSWTLPEGVQLMGQRENRVTFSTPSEMSVGALLAALSIPSDLLLDLKTREGSLEEAFLNVVQKGASL